jgi:hypothetical protein
MRLEGLPKLKKKYFNDPFGNLTYDLPACNTGCGKLTSFFEYEMPNEKGS